MNVIDLDVSPVFTWNWDAILSGYRYIINEGSSRSSKTYSLIDIYDTYARWKPNKRMTIWRDTKVDCVDTVFNDLQKHLTSTNRFKRGNTYNATKNFLRYSNASTIEAHGADDALAVHGLTQDVAWLNEPYKISRDIADQIDQRTSDFMLIDWNPRMAHFIDDLKKDPRAIVIKSRFTDNPFCPPNQRAKILSYQPIKRCFLVEHKLLTEKQAREYDIPANKLGFESKHIKELARCRENEYKKSASDYNWSVYGMGEKSEKPNRIFKWNEVPLSFYQELNATEYYYSDWGSVDPWAVGAVKYYDGALYVRELNYSSENYMREHMTTTERHQIDGAEEGIVTWLFSHLDIPFVADIVCDNNRKAKITALRESGWDYAIGIRKTKDSIKDGISGLEGLRVFYTHDSTNVKYEQENYSRKVDRYGIVLEEPEDVDNHHMDGIRYVYQHLCNLGVIRKI